jgi:sigma-B regulation protein RsbU (phosphoserine phosphatase)
LIPLVSRKFRFFPYLRALPFFIVVASCFCLTLATPVLGAQTFDATNLREPVDLATPWLVHAGDDPAYARPDFDDSQWTLFDPHNSIVSLFHRARPEVVWYRLHVKLDPKQTGLALREFNISRAFEVYVNGERVMASGQVAPYIPYTSGARLLARIPDRLLASGSLVIAMRVHIAPSEWGNGQDPGYYASNLTLGQQGALYAEDWLAVIGEKWLDWLDHLLTIGLGVVALVLFASQRRNSEYLWIAALGLLTLAESPEPVAAAFYNIPIYWEALNDLLRLFTPYILVSLYFSFVHQRMGWRWRSFLVLCGVMNAFSALQGLLFTNPLPLQLVSNLPFVILLAVVMPVVLAIHWKRGNREAGILLIPVVLFSLYVYAEMSFGTLFQFSGTRELALRGLTLIDRYPAGPFSISLNYLSGIASTVALAIIMLLRASTTSRRQAILESELAAAQQVQQVLLPEQMEDVPGFDVESVYQPAQQVGGDFFQVLPADHGGLLVVVGDVAGKGLPAAMLVSVLVGAIRGVAEYTVDPAELLSNLNDRLIGRASGGFSTALAAHITADGWVTIANAGHLSPYLDGIEVELPGALPLGVVSDATYETSQFYFAHGSRLTFYSDGVVEAQNPQGELFGFERAKAISTESAAVIVEAAKQFGQEDDITVVTIARHFALATAA